MTAPVAWAKGFWSSGSPDEPPEYIVECVYGDDPPELEGWMPLYASPDQLATFAARIAKAPKDERVAFEALALRINGPDALLLERGSDNYEHVETFHAWEGWQARASLPPAHQAGGEGWIPVSERLPAHRQSVALINVNQWENTPGDFEMNVRACGYLENWGGLPSHWSVRGERAITLESFTHWMALPKGPSHE